MMQRQGGFTIIELVVAMLITAIVFTLGYGTLNQALGNRESLTANATRLQDAQFAIRSFVQDFSQLSARPIRDPVGSDHLPALMGTETAVTLTRGGWMNPAGIGRTTLQRVRYVLEEGKLYRENWSVLDPLLDPPPARRLLLDKVRSISLQYMDATGDWRKDWPSTSSAATVPEERLRGRPRAVQVTIELEDWGRIIRVIEVPG
jgi:general secretion pathway protein J